jgi:GntR family transcriptional regulator
MGAPTDPVYLRVLEDLRAQIREGVLAPGARVPSRNGIITRYGVGETAAKHALQVLATEGLIEARAGSGSYVRAIPAASCLEHDRLHFPGSPFGLADATAARAGASAAADHAASHAAGSPDHAGGPAGAGNGNGQAPAGPGEAAASPRRLSWEHLTERVPPPPRIARRLALADGELVTRTRYLLTSNGSPVQLAVSYEPAALTAGSPVASPEQGPLAGRGVTERMAAIGIAVDQVVEDISVRPSLTSEATDLGIPAGALVLVADRAHYAGSRAVEAGEIVVPADRFRLRYRFPLPQ